MPATVIQALVFLGFAAVLITLASPRRLHPFFAIVIIATIFGLASGFSISQLGKAFGDGFSATLYSPGLVIVAAGLIEGIAKSTGASAHLATKIGGFGTRRFAALAGLLAGLAAVPASGFALLTPLLPASDANPPQKRQSTTITAALAQSASHGLIALAPVPIAAAAILGAGWLRVILIGVPLALVVAALGAAFASWLPTTAPRPTAATAPAPAPNFPTVKPSSGSVLVLLLAVIVPLLLLIVQSIGEFPSEPLGGGPSRELVIGVGRPLILLLIGVAIMAIGQGRPGLKLIADTSWATQCFSQIANILLIVGAAGGLQKLCQESGVAELLGERLLNWHAGTHSAVLIAFAIAAVIKTLQGSSLVSSITAAGMMQPVLDQLGLDAGGKAFAALAIGAGAMTISHVNDTYFWLVADRAGLVPSRGFIALAGGTLLQGLSAAILLFILSFLV
ncbi:MAG TPA: GntP family permease [Xanthobacteraceae bacterium]|jgi:GntP family gluconate:H+ symporter|nr:GntP family permease [Xanthobacteraceae bacterium]